MNLNPSEKIKEFRLKRGYSQEQLADISKISIRTIQRMEKGETTPKGDSLKKIAKALETTAEHLLATDKKEDLGYLSLLVLSGISYIIHPFLAILVPVLLWFTKRNKIVNVDITGKRVINFQVTWQILFFSYYALIVHKGQPYIPYNSGISGWSSEFLVIRNDSVFKILTQIFYFLNLALTLYNLVRIRTEKLPKYYLAIPFL